MFTPKKNELLSQQEMYLKMLHCRSGLKMSEAVEELLFTLCETDTSNRFLASS
jgi:ribosomal protein S24E